MKAILLKKFGGIEELYLGDTDTPVIGEREVLVKVHATALNRADLLQRRGLYPPPPGESEILGLEMSGEVVSVGSMVDSWKAGDRVFALLPGGGYAEYVRVPDDLLIPVPESMDLLEAAGIAEAFLTAWLAIDWLAGLKPGAQILIHAGASGVGSAVIQLAKSMHAEVAVTASVSKHSFCRLLGASTCIDYRQEDFEKVLRETQGGVDVVIDFIGAPYFSKNLQVLRPDGRMVLLGFMGGSKLETADLSPVLRKRLSILGSTLRARSLDYKRRLVKDFIVSVLPLFENGTLRPVTDRVFDWRDVQDAHQYMESNQNKGKILLKMEAGA